jgi:hypothetical protein
MSLKASGVTAFEVLLRGRFDAGTVEAKPVGSADIPHWKHSTGAPFLSFRRWGSLSSNSVPCRLVNQR